MAFFNFGYLVSINVCDRAIILFGTTLLVPALPTVAPPPPPVVLLPAVATVPPIYVDNSRNRPKSSLVLLTALTNSWTSPPEAATPSFNRALTIVNCRDVPFRNFATSVSILEGPSIICPNTPTSKPSEVFWEPSWVVFESDPSEAVSAVRIIVDLLNPPWTNNSSIKPQSKSHVLTIAMARSSAVRSKLFNDKPWTAVAISVGSSGRCKVSLSARAAAATAAASVAASRPPPKPKKPRLVFGIWVVSSSSSLFCSACSSSSSNWR